MDELIKWFGRIFILINALFACFCFYDGDIAFGIVSILWMIILIVVDRA